jgi:hypothetical protein
MTGSDDLVGGYHGGSSLGAGTNLAVQKPEPVTRGRGEWRGGGAVPRAMPYCCLKRSDVSLRLLAEAIGRSRPLQELSNRMNGERGKCPS